MEFEYCCDIDTDGNVCGEIAEIKDRQVHESTNGPTEHKQVRCLNGHTYTSVGKMIQYGRSTGQAHRERLEIASTFEALGFDSSAFRHGR